MDAHRVIARKAETHVLSVYVWALRFNAGRNLQMVSRFGVRGWWLRTAWPTKPYRARHRQHVAPSWASIARHARAA